MSSRRASRLLRTSTILAALTVTLSGCTALDEAKQAVDDTQDLASTTKTCLGLAEVAVERIDEIQAHLDDEAKLERIVRRTAADFEAKMSETDDPQIKQALRGYVAELRGVADRAGRGQTPDLGDLREANGILVDACS